MKDKCVICGDTLTSASHKGVCLKCIQQDSTIRISEFRPMYCQTGWMCPKCGSIYAPHISECIRCSPPIKIEVTH